MTFDYPTHIGIDLLYVEQQFFGEFSPWSISVLCLTLKAFSSINQGRFRKMKERHKTQAKELKRQEKGITPFEPNLKLYQSKFNSYCIKLKSFMVVSWHHCTRPNLYPDPELQKEKGYQKPNT